VGSAIEALDFETEPPQKVASAWLRTAGAYLTPFCRVLRATRPSCPVQDIARADMIEVDVICDPYRR